MVLLNAESFHRCRQPEREIRPTVFHLAMRPTKGPSTNTQGQCIKFLVEAHVAPNPLSHLDRRFLGPLLAKALRDVVARNYGL